jgi:hypothetical protein
MMVLGPAVHTVSFRSTQVAPAFLQAKGSGRPPILVPSSSLAIDPRYPPGGTRKHALRPASW